MGLLWLIPWYILGGSSPAQYRRISLQEKWLILRTAHYRHNVTVRFYHYCIYSSLLSVKTIRWYRRVYLQARNLSLQSHKQIPWVAICTSKAVIGFYLFAFFNTMASHMMSTALPYYFKLVLHYDMSAVSTVNVSLDFACPLYQWIVIVVRPHKAAKASYVICLGSCVLCLFLKNITRLIKCSDFSINKFLKVINTRPVIIGWIVHCSATSDRCLWSDTRRDYSRWDEEAHFYWGN